MVCVCDNNGYEALRQLLIQCQPKLRNRSLRILNALMGWKEFDTNGVALNSQIVKLEEIKKDGVWEVVEVAERSLEENEIDECGGVETTAIFFFHQEMKDVNEVGIIHTGAGDPFLQPRLRRTQRWWRSSTGTARFWLVWSKPRGRSL